MLMLLNIVPSVLSDLIKNAANRGYFITAVVEEEGQAL